LKCGELFENIIQLERRVITFGALGAKTTNYVL